MKQVLGIASLLVLILAVTAVLEPLGPSLRHLAIEGCARTAKAHRARRKMLND